MSGTDDFWRRADDAFDRALDLPAAERARFLAQLSASDPELHAEVEPLLRAHDRSEHFLAESGPVFGAALLPDLPPSMPDLPAGTRVGSYAILGRIGSGGMGVVYKAHDERLDRFVALKFLTSDLDADEEARSRFLTEARIASALDHPGIAVVHEIAETADHHVFVAMAFYEGATLKDRILDGPLPLDSCVGFAIQIAEALGAAHRHGIVHRDIKPANVIVTREGAAKIVDFGIARIAEAASDGESASETARGSPGYMSPEQRRGGEVDARADVWSFGVLLHEMLTGRRPREDFATAPIVPAALRPLLARCLERDPENRYADASELLADLRIAASGLTGGRARRRRPAVVAALGLVGLAIAATAATLWKPAAPPIPPAGTALRQDSLPAMDVTTSSLVAYRFYQEGRRSHSTGDFQNAVRLFDAALAEDPAFAMAAHYGWLARAALYQPVPEGTAEELLRLAEAASEAERSEIRGAWSGAPGLPAVAGTLPAPEPTDHQEFYSRGVARLLRGDTPGALQDLRRALELAPPSREGVSGLCRACDVLAALTDVYLAADSLAAAERVVREWIRREPGSASAWRNLVVVKVAQQRYDEAADANRRAIEISPGNPRDLTHPAESRIRQADFDVADRLLQDLARDGTTTVRTGAAWFQTISFRYQGRMDEALEAAERFAAALPSDLGAPLHRAQVLLEMGREAEAAALFDSSASLATSSAGGGMAARRKAWSLTHRATALAALGDTSSLARLADTIESAGRRSSYGRDLFLHHHVRGLLLAARGDLEAAAAAFRRAVYYPNVGYTRTNVELARVLIELGRPLEAVAILRPALRGPLEASNLYATHTEIHELLGRAWHAAGHADSAGVHDEWVLKAWADADPAFQERRDAVRRRAGGGTPRPGI